MIDSELDNKNIGLLKNLHWLRQKLDVYSLVSANAAKIKQIGMGISFFGFLQKLCVDAIALNICKIYEYEKAYELHSIMGVLKNVIDKRLTATNPAVINEFVNKYNGTYDEKQLLPSLELTVSEFRNKYINEINWFKTHRDKKVAHSEYGHDMKSLPSYDVMEKLFDFGSDFYALILITFVSSSSTSVTPCNLNSNRKVKVGLTRILSKLGIENIKEIE